MTTGSISGNEPGGYFMPSGKLRWSKAKEYSLNWEAENIAATGELSPPIKTTIKRWINNGFIAINQFLRTGRISQKMASAGLSTDTLEAWVSDLNAAISQSYLKNNVVLFRGINLRSLADFERLNFRPNSTVAVDGFMSATPVEASAKGFSERGFDNESMQYTEHPIKLIIEIHAPAGTHVLFVGGKRFEAPIYSPEPEVLFAPHHELRIESVNVTGNQIRVIAYIFDEPKA